MTEATQNNEPTWHDAARAGFRQVLQAYGLDDSDIVYRRTQEEAFRNLEARVDSDLQDTPLTPLELEVLRLEVYYMANFARREFQRRYGYDWTAGGKYTWIAAQTELLAFQVKCILEDVSVVVNAVQFDALVQRVAEQMVDERSVIDAMFTT